MTNDYAITQKIGLCRLCVTIISSFLTPLVFDLQLHLDPERVWKETKNDFLRAQGNKFLYFKTMGGRTEVYGL